MARIFLTEKEARAWGLRRHKFIKTQKVRERVISRLIAVLLIAIGAAVFTALTYSFIHVPSWLNNKHLTFF